MSTHGYFRLFLWFVSMIRGQFAVVMTSERSLGFIRISMTHSSNEPLDTYCGETDLSEFPKQFAVADDDHTQRKDETGDEERDDEGVIVEVS